MAVRFNALCRALGLQPSRIEQWVARGLFKPVFETVPGKAREWTDKDARALLVFDALYSKGMPAGQASALAYLIHGFKDDRALLVAWPDPRSNGGAWTHDIVRNRSFDAAEFASSKKVLSLVTVSLDAMADIADAAMIKAAG